ncbi:MAG: phage Gp37/Gp68 family protein [Mycobacterium sp.]|jgi:protein gp37|nr:MAG: phage Gp37/Gp68 family protein [Mycobacterium sp.]
MSARTSIEWTESTWNPVTGCTQVSPGCDHCYAKTIAERFRGGPAYPQGFDVTLRPHKLGEPLRWRRPRRIFVNSMSDLFHDDVPDDYIARVWAVMALAPRHTFQVLTKRHGRMRSLLGGCQHGGIHQPGIDFRSAMSWAVSKANPARIPGVPDDAARRVYYDTPWPLPNVWLGVSTENQQWADIRIPAILDTPAAVRWISAEPLLGPIEFDPDWLPVACRDCNCDSGCNPPSRGQCLDWVVVGGESGHGARPMHPDWARSLRDQCTAAGVPFLFKQWGEWAPERGLNHSEGNGRRLHYPRTYLRPDGTTAVIGDGGGPGACLERVGKKAAGRQLDGETWNQYPEAVA